jgi:ABC-2 type transport system permease protein
VSDATGAAAGGRELASRVRLLRAVVHKQLLLLVRYPVNTAAQLVSLYLLFAVIFFGGQAAAGEVGGAQAMSDTFDGLIVGWFLWTMSISAYFGLSTNVTQESQWGTLEQLYMSPYGFGTVMGTKVVSNVLVSMLQGLVILALMLATTRRTRPVDLLTILPISVFALMSVAGVGFVFAGAALVYKRIGSVQQLVQFAFIGLIAAPVGEVPWLRYLPLAQGSSMLQRAMGDGVGLTGFSAFEWGVLVGTAVAYVTVGYAVFRYLTRVARRRGVMGHY